MIELIGVLGPNRRLRLIGVSSDPIELAPPQLIRGGKTIEGWAGVTPADSADALRFVELRGVGAMIETYPLEQSAEVHARIDNWQIGVLRRTDHVSITGLRCPECGRISSGRSMGRAPDPD